MTYGGGGGGHLQGQAVEAEQDAGGGHSTIQETVSA